MSDFEEAVARTARVYTHLAKEKRKARVRYTHKHHLVPQFSIDDPLPASFPYDPYKFARCRHHHHSLRGCWLPKGHEGLHHNPNLAEITKDLPWSDDEGVYVTSPEIWSQLIDMLGTNSHNCKPN